MTDLPIFWTFRRCPYAIRARLAVAQAGVEVEMREILLRDKPEAFLADSASATVPCLRTGGMVLDESLDIMVWALKQSDPNGWLDMPEEGWELIKTNDGPFKAALDRTKYHTRYADADPVAERDLANGYLRALDAKLTQGWLFGDRATLADYALLPFIRQFANIDRAAFDAEGWAHLGGWLDRFLESAAFAGVMVKRTVWSAEES